MKSHHRVLLLSSFLPLLTACGTVALSGNPGSSGTSASTSASATASADLQTAITQFLGLTADQQVSLAKAMGNLDLLDWSQQNASASTDSRKTSFTALLASKPTVATALQAGLKAGGGQGGPGGAPGGMGGPGGPGGLPPNIEEIRSKYPELATALESMQSLTPDERRTQMDALFKAHPEWQSVLMPAGGPGGMGGPGGSPPPGGFGGPGGSPPPGGFGGPGGSPPPGFQPGAMPSASPAAS